MILYTNDKIIYADDEIKCRFLLQKKDSILLDKQESLSNLWVKLPKHIELMHK